MIRDADPEHLTSAGWIRARDAALDRDDRECQFCSANSDLEVHHVVPRRFGGSDDLENLVTVCKDCHGRLEACTRRVIRQLVTRPMARRLSDIGVPRPGVSNPFLEDIDELTSY